MIQRPPMPGIRSGNMVISAPPLTTSAESTSSLTRTNGTSSNDSNVSNCSSYFAPTSMVYMCSDSTASCGGLTRLDDRKYEPGVSKWIAFDQFSLCPPHLPGRTSWRPRARQLRVLRKVTGDGDTI